MTFKIAVIPGDGTGPEDVAVTVRPADLFGSDCNESARGGCLLSRPILYQSMCNCGANR